MRQTQNPYGVGWGVQGPVRRQCRCCFIDYPVVSPLDPPTCEHCRDHRSDGTPEQQAVCWREHADRSRLIAKRARDMLEDAIEKQKNTAAQLSEAKQATAVALKSRDRHRALCEAVMALHPKRSDGSCGCDQRPCLEREAYDATDFRRHRNYQD